MLTDIDYLILAAVLTWTALFTASVLRTRAWTPAGIKVAFGNRSNLPALTPLAGRAQRAAENLKESLLLYSAVVIAIQLTNKVDDAATAGAAIFFWARLIYWPVYLIGVLYLRTALWWVAIIGLGIMIGRYGFGWS